MEVKRLKATSLKEIDEAGVGLVVFATLNVIDKDRDVTLPGAFGEQLAMFVPTHNWSHVPLGKARVHEVGDEARAEVKMNLAIPSAKDWHSALKFDIADGQPIQEYSYGYDVIKESRGDFKGQKVRFLEKLKVHEVSPVLLGAGENTRTLEMKSGRKLADQIDQARAELADLVERVGGLKDLRAQEGRELPKDRREQLLALKGDLESLGRVAAIVGELAATGNADTSAGRKLYSEFVAIQSRITHRR